MPILSFKLPMTPVLKTLKYLALLVVTLTIASSLSGCQALSVQGKIQLPDGIIAFEPLKITVAAVDVATQEPVEAHVLMPKGANSVTFKLEGLKPEIRYAMRYWLLSQGGLGDNKGRMYGNSVQYSFLSVGGLSVLNHAYRKEGFLLSFDAMGTLSSMTDKEDQRGAFSPAELSSQALTLTLLPEPGVSEATNKILSEILTPDMTPYEREWAIYQYCVKRVPQDSEKINRYFKSEFNDYDNPLLPALLEGKTIWLGQPFLHHWLCAHAGLETELVELHPYISYYPQAVVMTRYGDAYYQSNPLMAAVYISETASETEAYYLDKYFNYPVSLLQNTHAKLVFREERQRYFGRGALYPPLKKILDERGLGERNLITLECKIQLPKGVYGSENGIWGRVTTTSGDEANPSDTDFRLSQDFVLKRHRRSHVFRITVVNTGQPYTLSYQDTAYGLKGSVTVAMPEDPNALSLPCEITLTLPKLP